MRELIRCRECYKKYMALGWHVYRKHGMSMREYKKKHGLMLSKPCVAGQVSEKMTEANVLCNKVDSVWFPCKNCGRMLSVVRDKHVTYRAKFPDGSVKKFRYCDHDCALVDRWILRNYS